MSAVAVDNWTDEELAHAVDSARLVDAAAAARAELDARDELRARHAQEQSEAFEADIEACTAQGILLEAAYVEALDIARILVTHIDSVASARASYDQLHSRIMGVDPSRAPAYVPTLDARMQADRKLVTGTIEPLRVSVRAGGHW